MAGRQNRSGRVPGLPRGRAAPSASRSAGVLFSKPIGSWLPGGHRPPEPGKFDGLRGSACLFLEAVGVSPRSARPGGAGSGGAQLIGGPQRRSPALCPADKGRARRCPPAPPAATGSSRAGRSGRVPRAPRGEARPGGGQGRTAAGGAVPGGRPGS